MTSFRKSWHILAHWLKEYYLLLVLIAIAAFYRYFWINSAPGGLFPDEAANGLDINSILGGDLQPFYERGNGREALFFYLLVPAVKIFGRTPFAHHVTVATIGILTVIFTYLLVNRWFGKRAAFVAGLLAAVSSWYVTLSRTAFRANLTPLFIAVFLYFATRFLQSKSRREYWWCAILSGATFALGFYTYISYRMMAAFLLGTIIVLFLYDWHSNPRFYFLKKTYKGLLAGTASALVVITPLALYFMKHLESLGGRSGQVSIFSPELNQGDLLGTFIDVFGKTMMGFITNGDLNWRHNVSGFPFLSFLVAPLFIAGLVLAMTQAVLFVSRSLRKTDPLEHAINLRRLPYFVVTAIFFLMLVPEVLTNEGIPHGLRLAGVIPMVFIIPVLFIEEIYMGISHFGAHLEKTYLKFLNVLLAVILVCEAVYGGYLYFGIAAKSPDYAYAFRSDLTAVSRYLNERNNKQQTYLAIDMFSDQSVEYQTTPTGQPYKIIDPATLWQGPAKTKIINSVAEQYSPMYGLNLNKGDQVIFSQSTAYDSQAFERYFPDARLIRTERNQWNQIIMKVYEVQ